MSNYPHVDRCLGLHHRLEIIYVVDGFIAELVDEVTEMGPFAHGETIDKALCSLNEVLSGTTKPEQQGYFKKLNERLEKLRDRL